MPKRTLHGVVVSDKQDKTIIVRVERRFTHPMLKKTVRRSKKYHAHDEKNESHLGDTVEIIESRPLSKQKRWELVKVVKKAPSRTLSHLEGAVAGADAADAVAGPKTAPPKAEAKGEEKK